MRRLLLILPLISALFLIFASCSKNYFTFNGEIWATSYHIVYSCDKILNDSIDFQMKEINDKLSFYNPSSELSAINSGITDSVGHHFINVFETARSVSLISSGVYDPTIAPLVELWGFGNDNRREVSASAIDSVLRTVGIADCHILNNHIVRKDSLTRFDFSSIAKGYGIDCIADMFDRNGVDNYLIEIGGEIAVKGVNPKGQPWHVQIDSPHGGIGHKALTIKALGPERIAMASSGNYRNFRTDSTGAVYGHTLSPITGHPVVSSMLGATVTAYSCAYADALATACMAAGCADSAEVIIRRADVKALLVDIDKGVVDIDFGL